MDPRARGLRMAKNAYFSLSTYTKKLLLVIICDPTAGIGVSFRTHGRCMAAEGQTGVEVEIVI